MVCAAVIMAMLTALMIVDAQTDAEMQCELFSQIACDLTCDMETCECIRNMHTCLLSIPACSCSMHVNVIKKDQERVCGDTSSSSSSSLSSSSSSSSSSTHGSTSVTYSQADLDAENALPMSAISDGRWHCLDLIEWKGTAVCTDPSVTHHDWAGNCPVNCYVQLGGELSTTPSPAAPTSTPPVAPTSAPGLEFYLVQPDVECKSADIELSAKANGAAECAGLCALTPGCVAFDFTHDDQVWGTVGYCYWEKTAATETVALLDPWSGQWIDSSGVISTIERNGDTVTVTVDNDPKSGTVDGNVITVYGLTGTVGEREISWNGDQPKWTKSASAYCPEGYAPQAGKFNFFALSGKFKCSAQQSIPMENYCDCKPDCDNGLDEVDCPAPPAPPQEPTAEEIQAALIGVLFGEVAATPVEAPARRTCAPTPPSPTTSTTASSAPTPTTAALAGFRSTPINCESSADDNCCTTKCKCGSQTTCSAGEFTCYGSGSQAAYSHCCTPCEGLDANGGGESGDVTTIVVVVVCVVLVLAGIGAFVWHRKRNQGAVHPSNSTYDIFLSYRVATSGELVEKVYFELLRLNFNKIPLDQKHIYLDKYCISDGNDWERDFITAVTQCQYFIPFISIDSTGTKGSLGRLLQAAESPETNDVKDNLLLEWHLARVLHMKGIIPKIYPVLDNGVLTDGGHFGPFDWNSMKKLSTKPSHGTVAKLLEYLCEYDIDCSMDEIKTWSAASTVQYLLNNQGVFTDNYGKEALQIVAEKINSMTMTDENKLSISKKGRKKEHTKHRHFEVPKKFSNGTFSVSEPPKADLPVGPEERAGTGTWVVKPVKGEENVSKGEGNVSKDENVSMGDENVCTGDDDNVFKLDDTASKGDENVSKDVQG